MGTLLQAGDVIAKKGIKSLIRIKNFHLLASERFGCENRGACCWDGKD